MEAKNNKIESLKKRLGINDFVCRGAGTKALDYLDNYILNEKKLKSDPLAKIQKEIGGGADMQALLSILETDPEFLDVIIDENSNLLKHFDESNMPEEYKKTEVDIYKMEEDLKSVKDLPKEKKKELETQINSSKANLNKIRKNLVTEKVKNNPNILLENPKFLKSFFKLLAKNRKNTKIEILDEEGKLSEVKDDIIKYFLIGKGANKLEVEESFIKENKYSLSRREFFTLVEGILSDEENGYGESDLNFFISTRS